MKRFKLLFSCSHSIFLDFVLAFVIIIAVVLVVYFGSEHHHARINYTGASISIATVPLEYKPGDHVWVNLDTHMIEDTNPDAVLCTLID